MSLSDEPTFDIPSECWGAVVKNEGPDFYVEVEKVPVPEIGPDEVLIQLNATGLCMSDVHFMLNDWGIPRMSELGVRCAGHEGAGTIVKVGDQCRERMGLRVGQRAGLKPTWDVCHVCEHCRSGREMFCAKNIQCGGLVDGSYKQYVKSPGRYTTLIPDGVSDYTAGPLMCAAATAFSALRHSGARPGQWAVFPGGGGGVGIQGVQLAAYMGLRPVVVDTGAARRELALKMGAEHFVDFREHEDPVARVVEVTEGGAHLCFVTAAQAYPVALRYLGTRPGGTVVCIGLPPAGKFNMDIAPMDLIIKGHAIKGSVISSIGDIDEVLQLAKRGKLRLEPTVVGLSKFNEAVQMLKRGEVAGRMVVDFNMP